MCVVLESLCVLLEYIISESLEINENSLEDKKDLYKLK